jgi:hypothetical protein
VAKLKLILALASVLLGAPAGAATNFLAGADFSDLAFFEGRGVTYKDGGQVRDGL